MGFYYNLYFFIAEVQNPISNILKFSTNTKFFKLNMKVYYYVHSIFRMILFPLMSYKIYTIIRPLNYDLALYSYISTLIIYGMSILYYLNIFIKKSKTTIKYVDYKHW